MRIAVDAGFWQTSESVSSFIKEIFLRLVKEHPEHQFVFLLTRPANNTPDLPGNIIPVVITPAPANFLLHKWWYDVKVPLALRRHKIDLLICTNAVCSLTTATPQLLIIPNLTFLKYPNYFDKSTLLFRKKFTGRFLNKAREIASFSGIVKKEIIAKYGVEEKKIRVVDIAAETIFKPLSWEEKEQVKEQYAQGFEYFAFTTGRVAGTDLVNLLKAFSIFKKWQKTNMKLVITVESSVDKDQLEKLNTYKYKKEIILAENLSTEELAKVTGAAYAIMDASSSNGCAIPVLEAMQCEVPVITCAGSPAAEVAGEAALSANYDSPEEIAEQMKRIFKDEQLRNKLAITGRERSLGYGWEKTVGEMWQLIQQAVSK